MAGMRRKTDLPTKLCVVCGRPSRSGRQAIGPRHPHLCFGNPQGSTIGLEFRTSKPCWQTSAERCHVSHVVGDSDWELTFCETLEHMDEVRAYAKNHALNFEVPYAVPGGGERRYVPDG